MNNNKIKVLEEKINKAIEILNYYDKYEELADTDYENRNIIIELCTMKDELYKTLMGE